MFIYLLVNTGEIGIYGEWNTKLSYKAQKDMKNAPLKITKLELELIYQCFRRIRIVGIDKSILNSLLNSCLDKS